MAGEYLPLGIDVRADGLCQPDDDAAGQRPPQAAETADDDRLERRSGRFDSKDRLD